MDTIKVINLDYASRTPPAEKAIQAFLLAEEKFAGNPNAAHPLGLAARDELTRIKQGIADLMGTSPDEVFFNGSAGVGNYAVIRGVAAARAHRGRHVLSTPLAHPSEGAALADLIEQGFEVQHVRLRANGLIDTAHLQSLLRGDTILCCVSAVDSELGVVQPLGEIAHITAAYPHCHLHIDAAQAIGKVLLPPFASLGQATLVCAAQKFHGIAGCGLLLKHQAIMLEPLQSPASPALGLAAACGAALAEARDLFAERYAKVTALREAIEGALARYPRVRVNSPAPPVGCPHIINVSVEGVRGPAFRDALSARGVCVSVKSACATDASPSRAVLAISDKRNAYNAWRISLSHLTALQEVAVFMQQFDDIYRELTTK